MIKVLTGNKAAANGVRLSRPDVIAMYPITPQTPLAEELAHFYAEGRLDCEMVEVESEHTSMSVITGACVAGGRVFTATSSWGLAYMNEALMYCAGMRVPAVMVDVTRETPSMRGVGGGRQDIMSIRDSGWIQIEPETCQEILDSVIMAYRLAEDPEILLPVVVAYDGFYLSHLSEPVDIPKQEDVDRFLARVNNSKRLNLATNKKLHFGISINGEDFAEYRYKTSQALERVKTKIEEVEKEFQTIFGRQYGGMVDTYRANDAEILILTAGSCAGTARVVIDQAREKGIKAGLARIRMFRPYPREKICEVLDGKRAVAVIDRSICLGWNCGHLFMEAKAVLSDMHKPPKMIDFIDGLASTDITSDHIKKALAVTVAALEGKETAEVNWLIWD
ncbi:MAG TPA: pyruvate synthase subunit PorA [Thermoanaerobacterales bacterium]|nr:pyruvate synthase subunit PorA [Thermoanaerobacterales bacterium]